MEREYDKNRNLWCGIRAYGHTYSEGDWRHIHTMDTFKLLLMILPHPSMLPSWTTQTVCSLELSELRGYEATTAKKIFTVKPQHTVLLSPLLQKHLDYTSWNQGEKVTSTVWVSTGAAVTLMEQPHFKMQIPQQHPFFWNLCPERHKETLNLFKN